jgi:hypothetical protein
MYIQYENHMLLFVEVGNARAKDCLKYLVLTSMLALKEINPFSSKEAKVFLDDKEVHVEIHMLATCTLLLTVMSCV